MLPHKLACRASALLVCHDPENWQAASVPPRASWVLETRLRKLAHGLGKYWCGCRESHPDMLPGKEPFCF